MGLQSLKGDKPTLAEAKIGKNYLDGEELYQLHILCEQWLIESAAIRARKMTMAQLAVKFDELLKFQGHEVFGAYKDFLRDRAHAHAARELEAWKERTAKEVVAPKKRPAA